VPKEIHYDLVRSASDRQYDLTDWRAQAHLFLQLRCVNSKQQTNEVRSSLFDFVTTSRQTKQIIQNHPCHGSLLVEILKMNKRKGWEGEELELEHERERMMKKLNQSTEEGTKGGTGTGGNTTSTNAFVAVDLNQFRNTEVGTGFQAKHVVRQRTASTLPTTATTTKTVNHMMMMTRTDNNNNNNNNKVCPHLTKEELLRNEGLRQFRKEIEKIIVIKIKHLEQHFEV
jgi:hypothetical protein